MDPIIITLDDIVKHRSFRQEVSNAMKRIKEARWDRKPAPAGLHYRRDWYDRLIETDIVTTDFICDNFLRIMYKMSDLPSETRLVIQSLGMEASEIVHRTIEAERAKEALAALNAEKPIDITPLQQTESNDLL